MKVKCVKLTSQPSQGIIVGGIYEVINQLLTGSVEIIDADDGRNNILFESEYEVVEE